MKTPRSKSSNVSKGEAVPVSFRLQFSIVAAAAIAWTLHVLYTFSIISSWHRGFGFGHLDFVMVAGSLFPLVVFAVALLSTPRFKQPISSLFIAVLKTLLAVFLYAVLVGLKNWLIRLAYGPYYYGSDGLRWLTSPGIDFALMGVTLFCLLWMLREQAKKKV
jgi:hypothetical protein